MAKAVVRMCAFRRAAPARKRQSLQHYCMPIVLFSSSSSRHQDPNAPLTSHRAYSPPFRVSIPGGISFAELRVGRGPWLSSARSTA